MINNYIKRFENIITPNSYNLNNFKEKLLDNQNQIQNKIQNNPTNHNYQTFNNNNQILFNKSINNSNNPNSNLNKNLINIQNSINNNLQEINHSNDNNFSDFQTHQNYPTNNSVEFQINLDRNNLNSEENKKLIEEYMQRMGIKDILESASNNPNIVNESKMRVYQKILEREGKLESPDDYNNENNQNKDNKFSINIINHDIPLNTANFQQTNNNSENFNVNTNNNISVNHSMKSKNLSLSPSRKVKQTTCDNVLNEREKIHMLNIKAMNYRHEVENLKKKNLELNKTIEDQKEQILKFEKQKENDNKYLIKLESLLSTKGSLKNSSVNDFLNVNPNNLNSSSNLLSKNNFNNTNFSMNGIFIELKKCTNFVIQDRLNNFNLNVTDQQEMKEFIANLMQESQKLKNFQKKVFEISKNYDDVNENIINAIKAIQNILEISSAKNLDDIQKREMSSNFERISENFINTLELKQKEFNFMIDSKEQEIKLLGEEIFKLNNSLDQIKRDRIREQKILDDYETQNNFLNIRIKEMNDKILEEKEKPGNSKYSTGGVVKERENMIYNLTMEKKVAPIKQSLTNTAKKIEKVFDMQDKSNIKLLSNINKNLK